MATGRLHAPRKLEKVDVRSAFFSGAAELDDWFREYAWQNLRANNAVTYVATLDDLVVGYYALCSAGVSKQHAPTEFAKARPADIPCVLLARLAVDQRAQGRGLGRHLFRDAVGRAVQASEAIGAACLLIHSRDDAARDFYASQADTLASPVNPLHLVLPIKSAWRYISQQTSS